MQNKTAQANLSFIQQFTTRRLLIAILLLATFAMALREIKDADLWWHLATGRYLIENRAIPREDIFSYTRIGTRWYTHEWLAEVVLYASYQLGSEVALILLAASSVTLTIWFLYQQCAGNPYVRVFILILGAVASAITWGVRPQMLTFMFAALTMLLVERYRQGRTWPLWAIPVAMLVWVNVHAGFFMGLGLLGVVLFGDGVARLLSLTTERTLSFNAWRKLALSFVATVAATLFNPNGYHMLIYPFETLGSSAMQAYIQEWASPNFHNHSFWPFGILLLGGGALLVWIRKRIEVTDLLLFFGLGFAGLLSARHIPLFVVVSVPVMTRALQDLPMPLPGRTYPLLNWGILGVLLCATSLRFYTVWQQNSAYEIVHYPVHAIEYIQEQKLDQQNIYNSYNWGGYLIWKNIPVYIDGRADVYMDDFIGEYLLAYQLHGDWRLPLEKYAVDYILIESHASFAALLTEAPEWHMIYEDDLAVIFTKRP